MARPALIAALALLLAFPLASLAVEPTNHDNQSNEPLHARIDALIDSAAIGPLAPRSSDADFVRRLRLDLTGVIPSADEARAFVADASPTKRERLIDELLASPAFVRHMTITLDVLLMERKPEKAVKQPEWEKYLYESLAADKPLDRLFQEVLAADGAEEKPRPAARFTLDRDAEPNLLTRDIGRLAFGMDLQCAQCHDHPLIDDYYQEDYYGLFAFVSRTSLFTDAKTKTVSLTEKADGEASFKSVFTGASSDRAQPRLPKGPLLLSEPTFAKGEEYKVQPDKTVRGVPRYSRRAALAEMLPDSREFADNLANRLWAHMLGRGLVHPLDFHHAANPPSNPALLALLATELAKPQASGLKPQAFLLRPFLRQLALTRAYQRSCDEPRADIINYADIAARLTALTADLATHQQTLPPLDSALAAAQAEFKRERDNETRLAAELPKLEAEFAAARKDLESLAAARQAREKAAQTAVAQIDAVKVAAASLNSLAALLPETNAVASSAEAIENQANELTAALQTTTATFAEPTVEEVAANKRVSAAEQAFVTASKARPTLQSLTRLERTYLSTRHKRDEAKALTKSLENRIALAKDILAYHSLPATEDAKAATLWASLVERWTISGQIAPLRPLTPEQLAISVMQATASLPTPTRRASEGKKQARSASEGPGSDPALHLDQLEKLRPTFREFVRYYGGQPGEEFQATVNQALFFGNGTLLDTWLKPTGENLIARLAKQTDTSPLADELYWSVFSRPPTDMERRSVADYLKDRDDRPAALAEITWALLSSTEFRFNH
jgi:hypothetical protein